MDLEFHIIGAVESNSYFSYKAADYMEELTDIGWGIALMQCFLGWGLNMDHGFVVVLTNLVDFMMLRKYFIWSLPISKKQFCKIWLVRWPTELFIFTCISITAIRILIGHWFKQMSDDLTFLNNQQKLLAVPYHNQAGPGPGSLLSY